MGLSCTNLPEQDFPGFENLESLHLTQKKAGKPKLSRHITTTLHNQNHKTQFIKALKLCRSRGSRHLTDTHLQSSLFLCYLLHR